MLVISRKAGQKIHIGDGIQLTVVAVSGNRVRIAIDAPEEVTILRSELESSFHAPLPDLPETAPGRCDNMDNNDSA
jgi:carbon storage regulator